MKKAYIAPQTETMALQAESMLAGSTIGVDRGDNSIKTEADFLSNGKDEWNSESWSTED